MAAALRNVSPSWCQVSAAPNCWGFPPSPLLSPASPSATSSRRRRCSSCRSGAPRTPSGGWCSILRAPIPVIGLFFIIDEFIKIELLFLTFEWISILMHLIFSLIYRPPDSCLCSVAAGSAAAAAVVGLQAPCRRNRRDLRLECAEDRAFKEPRSQHF